MDYLSLFSMPTMKITGRTSTITNAFINSIIPVIHPTAEEVEEALNILGIDPDAFQCAYCGEGASEWDHLNPLVMNKRPTGFISEIHNLVPTCGKCNQSKGNKPWREWMLSDAKLSPKSKGVSDLERRISRLEAYERLNVPIRIDFEEIVGKELWDKHWENWKSIINQMELAQELAEAINQLIVNSYKKAKHLDSRG